MAGLLQTRTDVIVRGGLDGLAARHRVYANNIANIETPGFHPSEVPFEAQLRQLRDRLQEDPSQLGRTADLSLEPLTDDQGADRVDGNGVQADLQVTRLAESTMTYEALAQTAKMRDAMLRAVVTDGRQ
jgi:flagellar basal-body rod protein FlgB